MTATRLARQARFFGALATGLILLLPLRLLTRAATPDRPSWLAVLFCRMLLWGLRVRVTTEGRIADRTLVVANHVSWTDILVLGGLRPLTFVAKSEVRGWPLLGFLAGLNATVFVRREERGSAHRQVVALQAAIGRAPVVLFAEGTTGDGEAVLPFRSSLFASAEGRQVQPVSLDYRPRSREWRRGERAHFAWDGDKTFWPHLLAIAGADPVKCSLVAHAPMTADRHRRKELAERCREIVGTAIAARRAARIDG